MGKEEKKEETLIQTIVPGPLAAWVKKQAAKEGISVAAWIRRLVMQSREREKLGLEANGKRS